MAQTPLQPLTVGNAVSAAFQLYRDRLSDYFKIALRGTLWMLLPILALIPIPLVSLSGQPNAGLLGILILVGILLLLFGLAKYTANLALISRLAFGTLANQPETVQEASSQVIPRTWSFLGVAGLTSLIIAGAYLAFAIVVGILAVISGLISSSLQGNVAIVIVFILLSIVIFIALLAYLIRIIIRFSIADIPLAIENSASATRSVSRSWRLTEGNANRILGIIMVGALITVPVQIIASILTNILQVVILAIIPNAQNSPSFVGLTFLISYALGTIIGVFLVPFWQALKAAIYYDLRTRKEGLDLQLRKRPI